MKHPIGTLPQEAIAALESGNVIEAIKIVRERTGLGLKEAKEAVEAYGNAPDGRTVAARPQGAAGVPPAAVARLEAGDFIGAIRITREALGIGLKDAKETVERHLAGHPETRSRLDAVNASRRKAAFMNLLVAVALGVVIYALLKWLKVLP
jgi:ribosomal protein L7/L12